MADTLYNIQTRLNATLSHMNPDEQLKKLMKYKGVDMEGLYPHTDDPLFNVKIYLKKEFRDVAYKETGETFDEKISRACGGFELSPHQMFIKQFISNSTPYNSILLFHGLGSGKTCSAIGISEEMRDYIRYMGLKKKIIILASEKVRQNFKDQLFTENDLKEDNGTFTMNSCVGNKLLREVIPAGLKNIKRHKLISQLESLRAKYYDFQGYREFSNTVDDAIAPLLEKIKDSPNYSKEAEAIYRAYMHREYSNTMLIVDEIHNLRDIGDDEKVLEDNETAMTGTTKNSPIKKLSLINLNRLAAYTTNMKMILLSATPMYNNAEEIVWLLNLMRLNDKKPKFELSYFFDKHHNLIVSADGQHIGENRLANALRGYVSFVRGEDPYSFPYRIFPSEFKPENSVRTVVRKNKYPKRSPNGAAITDTIQHLDVYMIPLPDAQQEIYEQIRLGSLDGKDVGGSAFNSILPIQALNITYPLEPIHQVGGGKLLPPIYTGGNREYTGTKGLYRVVSTGTTKRGDVKFAAESFEYKQGYEGFFKQEYMKRYAGKIYNILKQVRESEGPIIVYSQYIPAGCIPVALALEELGVRRHPSDGKNLFKGVSTPPLTLKYTNKEGVEVEYNPKYILVTGGISSGVNAIREAKRNNMYGENIKVIIISQAAAEGVDFKYVRQIHIMDPWYNMSRIEQTIGRGVRFCSHKELEFRKRNVCIYLYASYMKTGIEAADAFMYRHYAEKKAIKIGKITRLMKEVSVDCMLNKPHNLPNVNEPVRLLLSNGREIDYVVSDKPFSAVCDYMENCAYVCRPNLGELGNELEDTSTYNKFHMDINLDKIVMRMKYLFRQRYSYGRDEFVYELGRGRNYTIEQIMSAISYMLQGNEYLIDMMSRAGVLVRHGDYYYFKPNDIESNYMLYRDRVRGYIRAPPRVNISGIDASVRQERVMESIAQEIQEDGNAMFDAIERVITETSQIYNRSIDNLKRDIPELHDEMEDLKNYVVNIAFNRLLGDNINAVYRLGIVSNLLVNPTDVSPEMRDMFRYFRNTYLVDNKYFMLFDSINVKTVHQAMEQLRKVEGGEIQIVGEAERGAIKDRIKAHYKVNKEDLEESCCYGLNNRSADYILKYISFTRDKYTTANLINMTKPVVTEILRKYLDVQRLEVSSNKQDIINVIEVIGHKIGKCLTYEQMVMTL
jgi:hypothetical protein